MTTKDSARVTREAASIVGNSLANVTRTIPGLRSLRLTRYYAGLVRPLLILLGLCVLFSLTNREFLTVTNLRTLADTSAIPLVIAIGMTFVVMMGSIDLSVQGVMGTVSVATALLLKNSINANDWGGLGIAAGIGIGVGFGVLNGLLYAKARLPSLIVTLGTWFIGIGIGTYIFPGSPPIVFDQFFRSWALEHWWGLLPLDYVAVLLAFVAVWVDRNTSFGRSVYAIGGSEEVLRQAGISVARYKIAAFAVAGALAGLAGLMALSQLGAGRVDAGYNRLFPAISAVVIGGTYLSGGQGGVAYSLLGVLILSVLQDGMILSGVSPYIQQAVVGAIIVVSVAAVTWSQRTRLRVVK